MSRRLRLSSSFQPGGGDSGLITPTMLLCTRGGAVPHLTRDTLAMVEQSGMVDSRGPILVPANYLAKNEHIISKFGKGK